MQVKYLSKILGVVLFISSCAIAQNINDCNEIENYLQNKNINVKNTIHECTTNDEGNITSLNMYSNNIYKEDVFKILSYKTIKKLSYNIAFGSNYYPKYTEFPNIFSNITELEELNLTYSQTKKTCVSCNVNVLSDINKGVLDIPSNLKKLTLSGISLSQANVDEMSNLTHLEEIEFKYCDFDAVNFSSFSNLQNLFALSITRNTQNNNKIRIGKYLLESLPNLRKLTLNSIDLTQSDIDSIGTLKNLEELTTSVNSQVNFSPLKYIPNLTSINIYGSMYGFYGTRPVNKNIDFYANTNVKKLTLKNINISSVMMNSLSSLTNLEELILEKCNFLDQNKFNTLEYSNLTHLKMSTYDSPYITSIPAFIYKLTNLKHLDLSDNKITTISDQLSDLKNLEYLNLSNNLIDSELPESISSLPNLSEVDFRSNKNLKGKALTNSKLEQCYYSRQYSLCVAKNIKCVENYSFPFCPDYKPSTSTVTEEETITSIESMPSTTIDSINSSEPTSTNVSNSTIESEPTSTNVSNSTIESEPTSTNDSNSTIESEPTSSVESKSSVESEPTSTSNPETTSQVNKELELTTTITKTITKVIPTTTVSQTIETNIENPNENTDSNNENDDDDSDDSSDDDSDSNEDLSDDEVIEVEDSENIDDEIDSNDEE